jgi:hypothetical protein
MVPKRIDPLTRHLFAVSAGIPGTPYLIIVIIPEFGIITIINAKINQTIDLLKLISYYL